MTDFRDEQDRGAKASAVMNNPLVKEAFGQIREAYVDDWSHTDPSDTAKREKLFYLMKALEAFEGHFESVIRTGKMASQQVNELN